MDPLVFIESSDFIEPLLMELLLVDFLCFIGFELSFFMLSLDIELSLFIESCCMPPLFVGAGVCGDAGGVDWAKAAPEARAKQKTIDANAGLIDCMG